MAFAGLRKQINKANQYVTEKMGGAEGTKLDLDFVEMERKTDVTCELVEELQLKTKEFLQPNPTARAKMAAVKGISKLSGQAKSNTYPQPEGVLGECMLTFGKKLGEDSIFSQCLIEMGESMKQMADIKYSLDDNIKQNFLEPLHHLQTKDLKEVMHHRKKLQGRRLDFDCKRRRQAKGGRTSPYPGSPAHSQGSQRQDDEIKQAEEKFAESLQLAQIGMFNLLDNDIEQVAQMAFFAEGLLEYHQQCVEILKVLAENLQEKREEAANRPKMEFVPKTLSDLHVEGVIALDYNNGRRPPAFGSTQNLHTSNPASNLRHSSSIGNLPAHYSLANKNNNQRNGRERQHSVNTDTSTKDPFNMWDSQTDPWGGGGNNNNHGNNNNTHRSNGGTILPPYNNGGFVRPNPAPRNLIQNTPLYRMDPWSASPLPSPMKSPAKTPVSSLSKGPSCTALYDFEPENQGELGFKENDIITLINKIDDNWFEGSVNGRQGYFPVSYVQVNTPLPNM